MRLLDVTYPTPAENLAADEALLDGCEERGGDEILRFWESPEPFVVVGYANKIATEVEEAACQKAGLPVYRRCSGGGTVLQGPGCLSYALILRIDEHSPTGNISTANRFIMERNRQAVQAVVGSGRGEVSICGHTDLAIEGKKFSGNSQRRRKHYLLFHGTLLLSFDLGLIGQALRMPSKQPDYRADRGHGEFLMNLAAPAVAIKAAMASTWGAVARPGEFQRAETQKLAAEKYSAREWNFKF